MTTRAAVMMVTAASRAEAEKIARGLVEARLAACVKMHAVTSTFWWDGAVQSGDEWQLVIKTRADLTGAVQRTVCELHSYKVPEIIALPVMDGLPAYLDWISSETATASK